MNSGQYHRRPQLHGLPVRFQYPDGSGSSTQSTSSHRMFSYDNLPRSQPQQFMTNTPVSSSSNLLSTNFDLMNSMPISMSRSSSLWVDHTPHALSAFDGPNNSEYYGYSSALTENGNNGAWLRDMDSGVPRWMPENMRLFHDPSSMTVDGYEPSMYMIDPNKSDLQVLSNNRTNFGSPSLEEPRDFARLSIGHSPGPGLKMEDEGLASSSLLYDKPPPFMASNEDSEDGGGNSSREMTAVDLDEHGADEPYAKLIYRALMSAPNHSMVLQEIYQWFRENTSKGASDGKGWMNSIRHNLSMNAAFKKTERKVSGDESKKSTEWVLEDFAIKDGVQSTTRYRKGNSSKKSSKQDQNHQPAPARQFSGRKGGICASKTKLQRQRIKDDQDRERININARAGVIGEVRSASTIDSIRRAQFERQTRAQISSERRQRSPLTPPAGEMPSPAPHFFPKVDQEQMDVPFEDMYAFEDCQGVYLDDGPLFSNGQANAHVLEGGSFHAAASRGSGSAISNPRF